MTNAQKEKMYQDIEQHGTNLLGIFPNAKEQEPVKLCKKLRRLENLAANMALDLCNGIMTQHMSDIEHDSIKAKVIKLLGEPANHVFFINLDPRGYALKLTSEFSADKNIMRDWGGFGIIAPDFTPQD